MSPKGNKSGNHLFASASLGEVPVSHFLFVYIHAVDVTIFLRTSTAWNHTFIFTEHSKFLEAGYVT